MATALAKKSASQPGLAQLLTLVLLIVWLVLLPACNQAHNSPSNSLKAAIIDQLYCFQPNQDFIHQTTQELEDYGFEVDLYQGDEVTVDLYRRLPGHDYEAIIFRAHSGLLGSEGEIIGQMKFPLR